MNTATVIVQAIAALERAARALKELGREAEADRCNLAAESGSALPATECAPDVSA